MNTKLLAILTGSLAMSVSVHAATFTVVNTNNSGAGSLRQAILDANANAGADTVSFAITNASLSISPTNALPNITEAVTIDGSTQSGYSNKPIVELSGVVAGANANGFRVVSGSCIIRAVCVNSFKGSGVLITNGVNSRVEGCYLGVATDGSTRRGNGDSGVKIAGVTFGVQTSGTNTIGGETALTRNLISGNSYGIWLSETTENVISGNYIGTDATGAFSVGNTNGGIYGYYIAELNLIGGTNAGARNLISGNGVITGEGENQITYYADGIQLGTSSNSVYGNYIGVDVTGTAAIPNTRHGVNIQYGNFNLIGGAGAGEGNLISGNKFNGVNLGNQGGESLTYGGTPPPLPYGNVIQGNLIGTDVTGQTAIPNEQDGVFIGGMSGNLVGGPLPGERNVISGNLYHGVEIYNYYAQSNWIAGNFIGITRSNALPLPNLGNGVLIDGYNNRVGGANSGDGNVIAYNAVAGVSVNYRTGELILGNSIYANTNYGIDLGGDGVTFNDAGDQDAGANDFQNFPVLSRAVTNASQTIITASLNSSNSTTYRVEFFDNPTADPSGYGQGKTYLGFTNVTTDGVGNVGFMFTNPAALPLGHYITATATDPAANTSEFSAARRVVSANSLDIVVTAGDSVDPVPHFTNFTYTVTVTNYGPTNASAVFVTNTLSSGLVYVSSSPSAGSATFASGKVTWNVGALPDGAGAVLTITAHGTTTGSQSNSVVAVVNEPDNDLFNNSVVESTYIGVADLFVTLDDSPDPVAAGQVVTYVFGLTNRGPDVCSSANYSINIDSGSFITGATTTQGTLTPSGNSFNLSTGPIAVNAGLKVTVTAIPTVVGLTYQYGEASCLESDPDFSDNFRTESTTVTNGPGILEFASATYYVNENGVTALVPVQRLGGALGTVSASYASSNRTATAGSDYTAVSGTVTFTNGQTIANISVPITDDFAAECNETLSLNLFNPSGGALLLPLTNTVLEIFDNEITPVGTIKAVSLAQTNLLTTGNSASQGLSISDDGRYVAYFSYANNLVPTTDQNGSADVFIHDRVTHSNTLVSVNAQGAAANGLSYFPQISTDGSRIGFLSYASDLTTNPASIQQIYVRTLASGVNQLVSLSTNGTAGNENSYSFNFSTNGTKVAYQSDANDLVASIADTNFYRDVYYRDLFTESNILVSVNFAGTASGNNYSDRPVISADGRYVVFGSYATDLLPSDTNTRYDIYRRDIVSGTTALVSANTGGVAGNNTSYYPYNISADGRYVTFVSSATDLVAGTPLFTQQVFRRDMNTGTTIIVSRSSSGGAANGYVNMHGMSRDGRFVLFDTYSSNVATNDNNFSSDVFVRDCLSNITYTVSINRTNNGTGDNNSVAYAISPDGRYVTFSSTSTDLVNESSPAFTYQIYQRDLVVATNTLLTTRYGDTNGANGSLNDCVVSTNGVAAFSVYASDVAQSDGNGNLDAFARAPGDTNATLLSFAQGVTGSYYSSQPAMNDAGTKVAFQSYAVNLVTNDNNFEQDVFLRDLVANTTKLVSVNSAGTGGSDGLSENPSLNEDGRYVVFQSTAQDIAGNNINGNTRNAFLRDTIAGTNALISVSQNENGSGNQDSANVRITPDGRFILFESRADNLVSNDVNGFTSDIFIRTRTNNLTQLISLNAAGTASANSDSYNARISPDGRYVVYETFANNLGPADSNSRFDVYARDRQTGSNILCSPNLAGNNGGNGDSFQASIAADNDTVIFFSYATNLAAGDANEAGDVFAYHLAPRTLELISATPGGMPGSGSSYGPSISADGRYVAFQSDSTNLVATPDANGPYSDVFVRDLVTDTTTLVSINCHGTKSGNGGSYGPQISADGRYVIYISDSTDIVPGAYTLYAPNVFRYDRQTGTTTLISQNRFATGAGNASSYNPQVSSSGDVVAFLSDASDLIANDANHSLDIFAWSSGLVVTGVDLAMIKNASTNVTGAYNNFTYTLAVTNSGTAIATGVSVTDTLPTGVSFVSATNTQGTVTNSGGTITASIGNLGAGAGARVSVIVTAVSPGSITNSATATANESDVNPANNTSSVVVNITPLLPPPLTPILTNGNQLLITWPVTTPDIFFVQTTTNLTPVIVWVSITNSILTSGTNKFVILNVNATESERYYRLKQ